MITTQKEVRLPGMATFADATLGVAILGEKGSGKTSLVLRLFNDMLRAGNPVYCVDSGDRLYERALKHALPGTPVTLFDATKVGGCVVDLAKVMHHPVDVVTALQKLIPGDKSDRNFFFISLARETVKAAIGVLNHFSPLAWLPYDLVWLASRPKLLSALCKETRGAVPDPLAVIKGKDSGRDVHGTVSAYLSPIALYTALGDYQPLADPLEAVATERGVVVLGWNDRDAIMLEPVTAMVLELAASRAMSRIDPAKYLGIFADEIRSYVRLDFPVAAAVRGRRPKVVFCYTLHALPGFVDRYSEHKAREILGVTGNLYFLRLGDPITAKFAADVFGKELYYEDVLQPDRRWTRNARERYRVPPEEFLRLPYPDVANDRIAGYARTRGHCGKFTCRFLADTTISLPAEHRPVPDAWFTPKVRGEADIERLKFPCSDDVKSALK